RFRSPRVRGGHLPICGSPAGDDEDQDADTEHEVPGDPGGGGELVADLAGESAGLGDGRGEVGAVAAVALEGPGGVPGRRRADEDADDQARQSDSDDLLTGAHGRSLR